MVYYFAQNATIEAKRPESNSYEVVGAVQEVSFEWSVEDVKLYQFGTIKRVDAARHTSVVNVNVKLAKFGKPSTENDWFWSILNGIGWANESSSSRKVNITDSTNFPLFKIAGEFRPSDGSGETIYVEAVDVYFKTFNWGGTLGEYIIEDLQGEGADLVFSTTKPTEWANEGVKLAVASPTGAVTVAKDDTQEVTISNYGEEISGSGHKYLGASADTAIATFVPDASTGVFTLTGIKAGTTTVFASVDGAILPIDITVTGA